MSTKKTAAEVMDRSIEPDRVVLALNTIEESPSYRILATHKLLTNKYRVLHASDLHLRPPNSTLCTNCIIRIGCCPLACCCCIRVFEVPNGQMKLGYDGRGNYVFFGPGVHRLMDPFYSLNFENKCELVPLRVPILYCSNLFLLTNTYHRLYGKYCSWRSHNCDSGTRFHWLLYRSW